MVAQSRFKTKHIFTGIVVLALVVLVIWQSGILQEEKQVPRIGIAQFVEAPALVSARDGFLAGLEEEGFVAGEDFELVEENAQADFAVAQTIARKFQQDDLDLVLAIATPCAQAVANVIQEVPVLITAVTDPVSAGLVPSLEEPGGNLTGTTDLNPVADQLQLIRDFVPGVKTIGIIYNSGEINSVVQVEIARKAAEEMGLELREATVTNTSEVALAASALIDRVDAIYIPTDNTVAAAFPSVVKVTNPKGIPVFGSERAQVEQGAIATKGIDYFLLGKQTGKMAAEILRGKEPENMPIEGSKELKLVINTKAAAE
ncbi:MAG: ABC transporter substrate-binding protein, partial [Halanaerobium sp.]|nr:ABC transporter substrate-binding protein [Halanaerobium sp.]